MQYSGVDVGLASVRFCIALSPWISPATDYREAKVPLPLLITQGTMQGASMCMACVYVCLNQQCIDKCVCSLSRCIQGVRDAPIFQDSLPRYEASFSSVRRLQHAGKHECNVCIFCTKATHE